MAVELSATSSHSSFSRFVWSGSKGDPICVLVHLQHAHLVIDSVASLQRIILVEVVVDIKDVRNAVITVSVFWDLL